MSVCAGVCEETGLGEGVMGILQPITSPMRTKPPTNLAVHVYVNQRAADSVWGLVFTWGRRTLGKVWPGWPPSIRWSPRLFLAPPSASDTRPSACSSGSQRLKKHRKSKKPINIWYFGFISNLTKVMKPSLEEERGSKLCFSPNKPLKCNHNRSNAVKPVMISLWRAERTITWTWTDGSMVRTPSQNHKIDTKAQWEHEVNTLSLLSLQGCCNKAGEKTGWQPQANAFDILPSVKCRLSTMKPSKSPLSHRRAPRAPAARPVSDKPFCYIESSCLET